MYRYEAKDVINPDENIKIYKYSPENVQDEHTHDFIEIVYIASGRGQHVVNNISYDVERGDLLFFNFGQSHSFQHGGEMVIVNCLLKPEFLSNVVIILRISAGFLRNAMAKR